MRRHRFYPAWAVTVLLLSPVLTLPALAQDFDAAAAAEDLIEDQIAQLQTAWPEVTEEAQLSVSGNAIPSLHWFVSGAIFTTRP